MKKNVFLQLLFASFLLLYGCGSSQNDSQPTPSSFILAKGADIGWLSQMEASGYNFKDTDGTPKNCLQLLKDRGINTVRLRVWVNPSNHPINGHCSKDETVAMAIKAKNLGMRIMINFHYSDTWADPGQQNKPAAWASHSFTELQNDVFNHTSDVLTALKIAGVTPEWVQIGNEIPSGFLFPEGSYTQFNQLVQLLNKGYDATKLIFPTSKVVIHLDKGNDNSLYRWFFDQAVTNGLKFDVIGASFYPYWLNTNYTNIITDLENNLKDMVLRYNKEVMVVEVGGDFTQVQDTKNMLTAVLNAVKNVPNNKGLGVIYWEPEGEKSWSGYQLNAWQQDGKPSIALDAFKE